MPLTDAEQAELAELESKYGGTDLQSMIDKVGVPFTDFVTRAAIPTAAGAAGAFLGSRIPGAGPAVRSAAVPLLESGLSAAGEFANQALDITPDSLPDIALAGGLPASTHGLAGLTRAAISSGRLPGAAGGLHELAAESAPQLVAKVRPTRDVDAAWEQARAFSPAIPARQFMGTITKLRKNEDVLKDVPNLQYSGLSDLLGQLDRTVDPISGTIDLRTFDAVRKRLGEWSRGMKGPEQGAYRKLYGSILDDIESSAKLSWIDPSMKPAHDALKIAMSATRRDLAADSLEESITKSVFTRADGMTTFRANQVLNDLKKSKSLEPFRKALTKGDISKSEYDDMLDTLNAVTKIGAAPPGRGQHFGSGRAVIGTGATIGFLTLAGLPTETASKIALAGNGVAWLISRSLMSAPGRQLVKSIGKGGGHLPPATLGLLANVIRASAFSENEVDPSQLPPVTPEVTLPPVYGILPPERQAENDAMIQDTLRQLPSAQSLDILGGRR